MAKYYVNCVKCDTEFQVNLIGKSSTRQWKLENTEWKCEDCKEQERIEVNKKAKIENIENGFPPLLGSVKQIAWAETIRKNKSDKLDEIIHKINIEPEHSFITKIEIDNPEFKIEQLFLKDSANWWIDNRFTNIIDMLNSLPSEKKVIEDKNFEIQQKDAELEATIRPLEPLTETIAIFSLHHEDNKNEIRIIFPEKREDFRTIVKNCAFKWYRDGYWYKYINFTKGTLSDRVADIGNQLLQNGFIVRIFDEKMRTKAIEGIYEVEHTRWIMARVKGDYKGRLVVSWSRNENFYDESKKITSAIWSRPNIIVRPEHFAEVFDFANECDFKITPKAQEIIDNAKRNKEAALVPKVKKGAEPIKAKSIKKDFTPTEGAVDETLLD